MKKAWIVVLLIVVTFLSSCNRRATCPAYSDAAKPTQKVV